MIEYTYNLLLVLLSEWVSFVVGLARKSIGTLFGGSSEDVSLSQLPSSETVEAENQALLVILYFAKA